MKLTYRTAGLRLKHTFTISRSSRDIEPCAFVELSHDGTVGYGEAAPSERYGESIESVGRFLDSLDLSRFGDPFALDDILGYVGAAAEHSTSAKAAVDIALHDWIGKKLGMPLWKLWGYNKDRAVKTSFTIGIDSPDVVERKVLEAAPYPILKVKVGVPGDDVIIRRIRDLTDKVLRVDANEGWTSREQARDKILWLEEQNIEFVEQPMPAHDLDGTAWVRERVHVPLIADENVVRLHDIPRLKGAFDGINIKLMKCTGLREARRMIHTAQALEMKVMLGCMIESSVAISAAAQLAPVADYADLDGNVLIVNDPFDGVGLEDGKLMLNDRPGLGVSPR
jgi:L-alanine-DL-glutamate epimerase-like enolase superfamily enzyme